MNALIMRRRRLNRDRDFAGLRILAAHDSRDGRQLDDFLDKNHIPHRLIDVQSEQGVALAGRLHLSDRDLPALITPTRNAVAPAFAPRSGAGGRFAAIARGRERGRD